MSRAAVRPGADGLVRALVLSVMAAAVPIAGAFLFPDELADYEALTWLLLVVPAFLWAYERGWRGVATALAAGMATLSLTYAFAEYAGRAIPELLLAVVVIYVAISLGIGLFGERIGQAGFAAAAEQLALHDPLTGLPNRRHVELYLETQFAAAERGQPVTVVFFDLDDFAAWNDRNGTGAGDDVLRSFATMLRQRTRRMDLAARYGPEEFVSVLNGCTEEGALVFAARVQEQLRTAKAGAGAALPTVSAGIAVYRPDMRSSRELLQAAEQAMLLAKLDGRDRVRVHGRDTSRLFGGDDALPARPAGGYTAAAAAAEAGPGAVVAAAADGGAMPQPGAGRRVFLLTDDDAVRSELGSFLRSLGFAVTEGGTLTDALIPLQQEFDLVYMDAAQPGSSAADIVRELRQRYPATRVIAIPRRQGTLVEVDSLLLRADAHYVGLADPGAIREQLIDLLAAGDALREGELRQRAISDELRALDRQARLALAASEAKYRQVVQAVQEVIFGTDSDGRWTFLNPAWSTITGFAVEESLGRPFHEFLHPEDAPALRARFEEAVRERVPQLRHEGRWRTRSGMPRWIELRLQLDIAPAGTVVGSTGTLADVTERRHAEDALRRSEEYFRSLIENSSDMLAVLNADATIRYVSPAVERIMGYGAGELIGTDPLRLVHPDDVAGTRRGLDAVLARQGVVLTAELRLRDHRGVWRQVELTCRNLLLTPGVDGIVINGRDVTERRRAEAALRESEQLLLRAQKMDAIGRLAGGVAHDFNNLLTTIQGHIDLLIADVGQDSAIRSELQEVRDAAERATSLTRQLLAFSRRQVLHPRIIELNHVVRDMEKMLRRVIGENVTLATTLPDDAGFVRADPTRIEQVLLNLIVNARDAMPHGGTIGISTERRRIREAEAAAAEIEQGTYVLLRVRDNGTGMTPEVAAQAFDPFFTTKGPGGGTGLGLSTVYGIVKQSGGHAWLHSEPGSGTEVVIALPAVETLVDPPAQAPTIETAHPAHDPPLLTRGTILLVEDEKAVRDLTRRILERYGYDVITAAGGREAIDLFDTAARVDLLLTDVVMPGIGGPELASILRARTADLPVLFMSGYNEEAVIQEGVIVQGTSFLEKPFTPATLLQRIESILAAAKPPGHGPQAQLP